MSDAPTLTSPPPPAAGWRSDRVVLVAIVVMVLLTGGGLAAIALTGGEETPSADPTDGGRGGQPGVSVPSPTSPTPAASSTTAPSGLLGLVASDDFTGPALDPRWGLYNSTSPIGAIWSAGQVRVADGHLLIVGVGRNPTGAGNRSGGLCWCAPGGNQLYGRWEVRARFDAGSGYGQVIGLWPQSDNEIDGSITFANSSAADKKSLRTYVVWNDGSRHSYETSLKGDFTGWHTFSVEWRQAFVRVKVDNTLVLDTGTSGRKITMPSKPMHLFLQQAVGPRDGVPAANASTPAEVTMAIDWVRLYQ